MQTQYTLKSSSLVYTPGLLEWAMNGYHFVEDQPRLRELFTTTYGLPDTIAHDLLSDRLPYRIVDESVVFTAEVSL